MFGFMKKEYTYGDLFKLFLSQNSALICEVVDYRPFGVHSITVYLKNGVRMSVEYLFHKDAFEILEVGCVSNDLVKTSNMEVK